MTRLTLLLALALTLTCATTAWAQDSEGQPESPCFDQDGDALKTCLQEALDRGVNIVVPPCLQEDEAEKGACIARRADYQRLLAELTGQPCAGFIAEEKQVCEAAQTTEEAAPPKKKGLSKHEGTKMERLEGTGDEDE